MTESEFITWFSQWMTQLMLPLMATSVIDIVGRLVLAFCVYYDARGRLNKSATLWSVLSGLTWIAALVYLIVRANTQAKPSVCIRCGQWIPPMQLGCNQCGQPLLHNGEPVTAESLALCRRRAKTLLIVWIGIIVLAFVLTTVIMLGAMGELFEMIGELAESEFMFEEQIDSGFSYGPGMGDDYIYDFGQQGDFSF